MPTAHSIDLDAIDAIDAIGLIGRIARCKVRLHYHEHIVSLDRALDAPLLPELVAYYYANTTKPAFRPS